MRALLFIFTFLLVAHTVLAQARTRIAVVSDTHLGSTWTQTPARIQIIRDLLLSFSFSNTTVHTVVLAGDLLENWLYKFDETPISYVELLQKTNIFNANIAEIVTILKAIVANNVKLVYLPGNHDDLLADADFRAVGLNLTFIPDAYVVGNIRIEHGHHYDLFNAPDPANVRPFGYFVSRAVTQSGRSSTVTSTASTLCQLFLGSSATVQALRPDSLGLLLPMMENALGGSSSLVLTEYNKVKHSTIKHGCYYSSVMQDTTLGKAMQKYKSLVGRMMNARGDNIVEHMIDASCFNFDYFVPKFNSDLVVFGHTHKPIIKTYSKGTSSVVYANSGGFVDDLSTPTYVVIETTNTNTATFVRLMEHVNGEWQLKQGATVNSVVRPHPETPASWTCPRQYYGTGDKCDCNCGAYDPDCDTDLPLEGCNRIPFTSTSCSKEGFCKYSASQPSKFTCGSDRFFTIGVCNCGCGAYDPACSFAYKTLSGCPSTSIGCSFEGNCIANGSIVVPPSWKCPADFYGSDDGCDCNCGTADPDCKNGNTACACDGNKTAGASLIRGTTAFLLVVIAILALL